MIYDICFSLWLNSLCMTDSVFIHLTTNDTILFLFMTELYSIVYMYHSFFIHSSVDRHLGCFYVLAIVNIAAMNIGVHVSFWISAFVFFSYIYLGVELLGHRVVLFLIFWGHSILFSTVTAPAYIPPTVWEGSLFSIP